MAQPTNFKDAHKRHLQDAKHLYTIKRWGNADHLFGFSAECGLKAIMVHLGMEIDATSGKPKEERYRKHCQDLWNEFVHFAKARTGAVYLGVLPEGENPFKNWSHNDRYSASGFTAMEEIEKHRHGAHCVSRMVYLMEQNSTP